MLCIASCRTLSPAAVQLRKLVAAGEIPDTAYACIAVIDFLVILENSGGEYSGRGKTTQDCAVQEAVFIRHGRDHPLCI